MRQIIAGVLRRWWGAYVIGALFAGALTACVGRSFTFVGIFMIPFVFDLGRRPVGVMVALPVSRRTIALSYWCVAVLLPVMLIAGTVSLVGLLSPSVVNLSKNFAVMLFCSLVVAGSSYCFYTFILPDERGSDSIWLGLWLPATMFGSCLPEFFDTANQSPGAYLGAGLLGLLLTFWGYLRSEKLVTGRTRKRPAGGPYPASASKQIPATKPGMARFGSVFFDAVRNGFLFGLAVASFLLILKSGIGEYHFVWPILFINGSVFSALFLRGGVRLLRSLPLSTGQLALALLLMQLFGLLGMITGVATIQWIGLGHFLIHYSASLLIPLAGVVCAAFSLAVRGGNGSLAAMALAMPASAAIFETVSNVKWPAAFWWLLGIGLIVAAFFLNRHWLRSSSSYRASTGKLLWRGR